MIEFEKDESSPEGSAGRLLREYKTAGQNEEAFRQVTLVALGDLCDSYNAVVSLLKQVSENMELNTEVMGEVSQVLREVIRRTRNAANLKAVLAKVTRIWQPQVGR